MPQKMFRIPKGQVLRTNGRTVRGGSVPVVVDSLNAREAIEAEDDETVTYKGNGVRPKIIVPKSNQVGANGRMALGRGPNAAKAQVVADTGEIRAFGSGASTIAKSNVRVPLSLKKRKGSDNIRISF